MSSKEKTQEVNNTDTPVLRKLILFNSNHIWDDVILQLNKATGFDMMQCEQIALIAHIKGKALVKTGEYEEVARINKILKEINLKTEIN